MGNTEKVLNTTAASLPSPVDFLTEQEVARATGLTMDVIRGNRTAGAMKLGKTWLWSREAVQVLELKIAEKRAASETPAVAGVVTVKVARVRTPRVLHVVMEGEIYDPAVPRALVLPQPFAHLFVAGMSVAGRLRPGTEHVFDYAGHPEKPGRPRMRPRRVGFW